MKFPSNKAGDESDGTETTRAVPHTRVLVVEDDATTRKLVSQLLVREGYEVATAADGVEAIVQAKRVLPDLMILDLALPSMDPGAGQFDGFGVLRWLDLQLPKIVPTIVLTCRQDEAARGLANALGVRRFLTKPFRAQDLMTAVREVTSR
jgi:chemosensory pili system protein ChpA (sensor histidine kinase/response regulator)